VAGEGEEVGDQKRDERVRADRREGRVLLHGMQFDLVAVFDEGQERNLRVAAGRRGDQSAVALPGHKGFGILQTRLVPG
jgi:hypothetical protein